VFSFYLLLHDCYRKNQIAWADIVNYIHTLDNLAKAGVNAIEVLGIAAVVADEELRTSGILASVCHREDATVVILTLGIGLTRDCPTRTTCAIADRATALNYKFGNYSVEGQTIIEA
jgi:hypothetical protein